MIGQTISHYKILEKLGEGGMGVVYKAYDTTLKRPVALKFLSHHLLADEQQRRRFLHEAQAAAGLTHPNICTVHEIHEADGHAFMVMEYIEGKSLKDHINSGPLEIGESLDLTIQVGKGLSKAHAQGIVHRDVKPGNVLLTPEGDAKIVDFGLAKLAAQTRLTRTGATVGTVMYMSPEQAKGDAVDHRTDVWSLGVMLYEMLTGKLPFRGEIEQAVVYSIINQNPEPMTTARTDVPVALEEIVETALAKDPRKRFETMAEMVAALETAREESRIGVIRRRHAVLKRLRRQKRLAAGALAFAVVVVAVVLGTILPDRGETIDSLAVLPLEDISGDTSQVYFADGITGEIITNLTKIGGLEKVSPRSAVMRYRQTKKPLHEIAAELRVKGIVSGTVQRQGDRVRITAELAYAPKEKLLWSESFEGDMENILALQGELAREIAREIHISLTPAEELRLSDVEKVDPEAYDAFLKGKKIAEEERFASRYDQAVEYFQEAMDEDPRFAPAYAALAEAYTWLGAWRGGEDYRDIAKAAALKATQLAPELTEGWLALGHTELQLNFDWRAAERAYAKAGETASGNPGLDGLYLILAGRFDEGIAFFERRIELDPLNRDGLENLAWAYLCSRRFDDAIASYEKNLRLFPGHLERDIDYALVQCFGFNGMFDEAFATIEKRKPPAEESETAEADSTPSKERWHSWEYPYLVVHTYACAGNKGEVQEFIDRYDDNPAAAFEIAEMCAAVGFKEKALQKLEEAWRVEPEEVMWLNGCPLFDPIKDDPRFIAFRERVGLPPIQWSSAPPWSRI